MKASYREPNKIRCRQYALRYAVRALTENRQNSVIATPDYVAAVRDQVISENKCYDAYFGSQLSDQYIKRWQTFHQAIVQSRRPENLRVAYLCGPHPENDLRELLNCGILPENVWAFEHENELHNTAIKSAFKSGFSYLKIHKGSIDNFVQFSPTKFDIIYLDFTGPLPSTRERNLRVLRNILYYQALQSPGALITNFSLPSSGQDEQTHQRIAKLASIYLYPKPFHEYPKRKSESFIEGPSLYGYTFDRWSRKVFKRLPFYYSQYITRVIMDLAIMIIPSQRFIMNASYLHKIIDHKRTNEFQDFTRNYWHGDDAEDIGTLIPEMDNFPVLWSLVSLLESKNRKNTNYPQEIYLDKDFLKFANFFLGALSVDENYTKLVERLEMIEAIRICPIEGRRFLTSRLRRLYSKWTLDLFYQFCDVFLKTQYVELLIRQLSVPYHPNVSQARRWSYMARDTEMFVDVNIFDECRYIYDWLPTIDMIGKAIISDIERQLVYRFALDAVAKHGRWMFTEFDSGSAIVNQDTKPFHAKTLAPRVVIK